MVLKLFLNLKKDIQTEAVIIPKSDDIKSVFFSYLSELKINLLILSVGKYFVKIENDHLFLKEE